jgi:glycosyltransferase involved in cell wall biosynthesis
MKNQVNSSSSRKKLISVVVYCHNEGRLLHYTLKSILRATEVATSNAFNTEIIVVADAPSRHTIEYLAKLDATNPDTYSILYVDYNDRGLSFNEGIKNAQGEFISTIEGDCLISGNWLCMGAKTLSTIKESSVVHPEYELAFGDKDRLWKREPSLPADHLQHASAEFDMFGSVMMTRTEFAKAHPYMSTSEGFSDYAWHWNCQTIALGTTHKIIPRTLYARRFYEANTSTVHNKPVLQPTKYLLPTKGYEPSPELLVNNMDQTSINDWKNNTLAKLRQVIDYCYRSYPSRKLRNHYPRLGMYATSLRNETLHLMRPIIPNNIHTIPDWVEQEVHMLHNIELRIFLSEHLKKVIEHYAPMSGAFAQSYWYLARQINTRCDYLIVVPYLKNGGAERELSYMIRAVLNKNRSKKITVLATDPSDSPWAKHLDSRVNFVNVDTAFHTLDSEEKGRLIAWLCIQMQPKKLHIINSVPGYIALQKYAQHISQHTKIFITIFMIDRTREGRKTHMFTERMDSAIDYTQTVFTDNSTVVFQLIDLMAIDPNKFTVLDQPTELGRIQETEGRIPSRFTKSPVKVLWAGRLDRQKRPDILVRIADAAQEQDIEVEFHVYGSQALEEDSYLEAINNCKNLYYHGEFQGGLTTLPTKNFDIFLLTSEWEGMPNVVLEAISEGLLVIAANVGGVNETIKDGRNGYIVEDFNDIDVYIEKISKSIGSPEISRQLIISAQKFISKRHSWENYTKQLREEKNYLS